MQKKGSSFIKRIATIYMIVFALCTSVCSVFATDITYDIKEIGLSLNIPNNMQVITREIPQDDMVFSTFGLDYNTIMNDFNSRSIYLQAADIESFLTITVTMTTTEESTSVENYNNLSEDEINSIKDEFLANPSYQECVEKDINGCKYFCLLVSEKTGNGNIYSQQYNTVVNGNNYTISLQAPRSQQLTSKDKAALERVMKSVKISNKTFFAQYGSVILVSVACVVALAGVIALFIILYKVITNPQRKHNNLIHQLAHEHKITETARIPRDKLHQYMIDTAPEISKPENKYEVVEERKENQQELVKTKEFERTKYNVQNEDDEIKEELQQPLEEIPVEESNSGNYTEDYAENNEPQEIFSSSQVLNKAVKNEDVVVIEESEDFGGTDYFDDVPADEDMYAYSDVEKAVDDYSAAKREASRQRQRDNKEKSGNIALKILKAIGKGIVNVVQTIFVVICYLVVHIRYFCINLYRLIKRKRIEKKRRKIQEEKKRRAEERRRMQREAEMHRQRENRNRGENDLVMVRSREESRNYSRESYYGNYDRNGQNRPRRR